MIPFIESNEGKHKAMMRHPVGKYFIPCETYYLQTFSEVLDFADTFWIEKDHEHCPYLFLLGVEDLIRAKVISSSQKFGSLTTKNTSSLLIF